MTEHIINDETKLRILEGILASSEFSQAKKHQDLLRYLVEASIRSEFVKESSIALEIFGKDAAFSPAIDSSVRAYVSNLRKKLEHYYLTQGVNDKIKLVLPKGHYHVEFREAGETKRTHAKNNVKLLHSVYGAVIALLLITLIFSQLKKMFVQDTSYIPKEDAIWSHFLSDDKKTMVILGDYYFFSMPFDSGRHSYIRDTEINSHEDLDNYLSTRPALARKINKTFHTYFEEHIPYCLSYLLPLFIKNDRPYELKMASEVQMQDLQKYNFIFIGPYKSLGIFKTVTRSFDFTYEQKKSAVLTYAPQDGSEKVSYSWTTNPETMARNDYALVAKVSGHNNNSFLFFLSQHDFGNMATVKYFVNPANLQKFEKSLSNDYFQALFEVKGIMRTDFELKLLHLEQVHSIFVIE